MESVRSPRRSRARDPVLIPIPSLYRPKITPRSARRTVEKLWKTRSDGGRVQSRRPACSGPSSGRRCARSSARARRRRAIQRLKDRAAAAGLIYAVEDFHNQAELAIARYSSDAGAVHRDADRTAWRQAGRPAR